MKKLVLVFILGYVCCAAVRNHFTDTLTKQRHSCLNKPLSTDKQAQEAIDCLTEYGKFSFSQKLMGLIHYDESF